MIFTSVLTVKGLDLISKAGAGAVISFTKIKTGSGIFEGNLSTVTDMAVVKQSVDIISVSSLGNARFKAQTVIDNTNLDEGYTFTEYGVYAIDPDIGEILFSYGKATQSDYMPGKTEGYYSYDFSAVFKIDNAASINITVEATSIYLTISDFDAFKIELDERFIRVETEIQNYVDNKIDEFKIELENSLVKSKITGNHYYIWYPSGLLEQGNVTSVNDVIFDIPFDDIPISILVTPIKGGIQTNAEVKSYSAVGMKVDRAASKCFWVAKGYKSEAPED